MNINNKCAKCNAEIFEGSKFCSNCGFPNSEKVVLEESVNTNPNESPEASGRKKSRVKMIAITCIGVISIMIIIATWVIIERKNDNSNDFDHFHSVVALALDDRLIGDQSSYTYFEFEITTIEKRSGGYEVNGDVWLYTEDESIGGNLYYFNISVSENLFGEISASGVDVDLTHWADESYD